MYLCMYINYIEGVTETSISAWARETKIHFSDEFGMHMYYRHTVHVAVCVLFCETYSMYIVSYVSIIFMSY